MKHFKKILYMVILAIALQNCADNSSEMVMKETASGSAVRANPLQIKVSIPTSPGGTRLVPADLIILDGTDTIQTAKLGTLSNTISFAGDPTKSYLMVIIRSGYARYQQIFNYPTLMSSLAGLPLSVTLTPALTFKPYISYHTDLGDFNFILDLEGTPGTNLVVDWGDGSPLETFIFEDFGNGVGGTGLTHSYAALGSYFATAIGGLDKITYFKAFYGQGQIDDANFDHLPMLQGTAIGLTRSPETIDLRQNSKLAFLNMANAENTVSILLPVHNNIQDVDVSGPNKLTSATLGAIITKVYENAVAHHTMNGYFTFDKTWYPETNVMVKTPSAIARAKLVELRDVYGWHIHPNP